LLGCIDIVILAPGLIELSSPSLLNRTFFQKTSINSKLDSFLIVKDIILFSLLPLNEFILVLFSLSQEMIRKK